jgi:MoaA/NifB/PqqE/SkfB family radical SAM enzyme
MPMHATLPLLRETTFPAIRRRRLDTLQVNVGYKCNQSCVHCHVNAGPTRTEMMGREVDSSAFLRVGACRRWTSAELELNPISAIW